MESKLFRQPKVRASLIPAAAAGGGGGNADHALILSFPGSTLEEHLLVSPGRGARLVTRAHFSGVKLCLQRETMSSQGTQGHFHS